MTQGGLNKNIIVISIGFIVIGAGVYFFTPLFKGEKKEVRYVLSAVKRGTVTSSVSGSGQVSNSNQIDIKPKVSGDFLSLSVVKGQEVKEGDILARIDDREVKKSLRDAQLSLKSVKLSLEKLKKPADEYAILQARNAYLQAQRTLEDIMKPIDTLTLLQAENALTASKESKQNSQNNLTKAYEDGFNLTSAIFLDLPGIMSGLNDMLFDNTIDRSQWNIGWYANQASKWEEKKSLAQKSEVEEKYKLARKKYDDVFEQYRTASRSQDVSNQERLILQTYETTQAVSDAVKATNNYIDFIQDIMQQHELTIPSPVVTHQGLLDTYTSKINPHNANLLSIKNTLQTQKDAIISSNRTIAEKTENLEKIKKGPERTTVENAQDNVRERQEALKKLEAGVDALDIESQQIAIQQKQHIIADLQETLKDYVVVAPFDGTIVKADVKKTDAASPQTVLATLVTHTRIAEITLNEVDQVKVKTGNKAILTFDALPDMNISGQVAEIDSVGTVSQGVVSYTVKIGFDISDERIKSGMSVSASIITDTRLNTLFLPIGAIKSQREQYYVEIIEGVESVDVDVSEGVESEKEPIRKSIEVGISGEDNQEILSGLAEGEQVVISKIDVSQTAQSRSSQQPAFRVPGLPSGGGGGGGNRGNFGSGNTIRQR